MLYHQVNDMLDFARIRANKFQKIIEEFDFKMAIYELVEILQFQADSMDLKVVVIF